ncbi:MAG: hypothetical protein FWF20_12180 [Betaproteobacteria bacterium]|nr:hypothetical protein [Betaproteobacteria bacterium]MCL2887506.1 hypothetical protein [Betaproteobacteria bacterium]
MNKKILIDLIGVLLIALVVVVGYKLSPLLLPRSDVVIQPDPTCSLQRGSCRVALPAGGSVELTMGSLPIPLARPFEVRLVIEGLAPARVEVDFAGVDMNMGYNRTRFAERGNGLYAADVTLPVCITGMMEWQATVLIEAGGQRIAIPWRFATGGAA